MGIPQVIFLILATMDITMDACWHGQPKQGTYSVGWTLFQYIVFGAILYWGGFFR